MELPPFSRITPHDVGHSTPRRCDCLDQLEWLGPLMIYKGATSFNLTEVKPLGIGLQSFLVD